jgi:class 3 adenylate cyclase
VIGDANDLDTGRPARTSESGETFPLPEHPSLAAWASALNETGHWANVLDATWRFVFQTEELRKTFADMGRPSNAVLGSHFFSQEVNQRFAAAVGGPWAEPEFRRSYFSDLGPYVLAGTPGGRAELRRVIDPELADLVDELQPEAVPKTWVVRPEWTTAGAEVTGSAVWFRIDDDHGNLAGFCILSKPAAGMSHLGVALAIADHAHLDRMRVVAHPDRRPAAVLMADLEASSLLARRLSTAQYFAFGRRLVRTADRCIIEAGGIIGRHAGDGVVAFFLADTAGSESCAARSCITAARKLRDGLAEIATRGEIPTSEVSLRFGLHWGGTLYMGRVLTGGRSEVTALGDEVNEAARIEASAAGGRILASKALVERLDTADAEAVGIETRRVVYTPLGELPTATDKARRDAPLIAVCDLTNVGE